MIFIFQNCSSSDYLGLQTNTSRSSSGNGGVYGGLQPPDVLASVKSGQTVVISINGGQGPFIVRSQNNVGEITAVNARQFVWVIPKDVPQQSDRIVVTDSLGQEASSPVQILVISQTDSTTQFGKASANIKNLMVFNVETSTEMSVIPGCAHPGALQVFAPNGDLLQEISFEENLCEGFGKSMSAYDHRLIVSGIKNTSIGNSTYSSQAAFATYRLNSKNQLEKEQVVVSKRRSKWGWVEVGLSGDRAFLHFSSWSGSGSVIEVYKYRPAESQEPWTLESTLDFSESTNEHISSFRADLMGRERVKFSDTDQTLFIRALNNSNSKEILKIYKIEEGVGYKLAEQIDLGLLLPIEVLQLGSLIQVQSFQHRNNEIFMMISWASGGDHYTKERMVILQKKAVWTLLEVISPPNGGKSYNERYHSSVGRDHFIIMNSILRTLLVYRKVDGRYLQVYDLSGSLMKNGFARDALMRENQIMIPFYRQVFVIDLN